MQHFNPISAKLVQPYGSSQLSAASLTHSVSRIATDIGPAPAAGFNGISSSMVSISQNTVPTTSFYHHSGKRLVDILIVLATLPVTLPIMFIATMALWIESGLPVYRQERLGRNGRSFWIFKLRTMARNAEEQLAEILAGDAELKAEWETTQKLKDDPRITRIGAFLRSSSIDELPQIWNVLKGDMSLVGPRPMLPDQLDIYGDPQAYFALLPGISGFWQVSQRNESHFAQRTEADRAYLEEMSFGVDLGVLLKTSLVVLRRTGY